MPNPSDAERLRATIEAVHAPPQLHAQIARQRAGADRRRPRIALVGSLAAAAAAAAVILAIVLPGGSPPTVLQVAQLGTAPPTRPAPAVQRRYPEWLNARVGDVRFPSWRQLPGWRATGARHDSIGGRNATTVYYAGPADRRVAYTVVDGAPLPWPARARVQRRGSTAFRVVRNGDRTVVTWREGGHQCVMAAPRTVPAGTLVALAAGTVAQAEA